MVSKFFIPALVFCAAITLFLSLSTVYAAYNYDFPAKDAYTKRISSYTTYDEWGVPHTRTVITESKQFVRDTLGPVYQEPISTCEQYYYADQCEGYPSTSFRNLPAYSNSYSQPYYYQPQFDSSMGSYNWRY